MMFIALGGDGLTRASLATAPVRTRDESALWRTGASGSGLNHTS